MRRNPGDYPPSDAAARDLHFGMAPGRSACPASRAGRGGELSLKEVEAQDAFTQMRHEVLSLSDGVEVNEVLGIIDNHTPEWV